MRDEDIEVVRQFVINYPDPMPWQPIDAIERLLIHVDELRAELRKTQAELARALRETR